MKPVEMDVYSELSNYMVARHPGRKFPGALVQGDSLYVLTSQAEQALERLRSGATGDAKEVLAELAQALRGRLEHYKRTLDEHGMELPFVERRGES